MNDALFFVDDAAIVESAQALSDVGFVVRKNAIPAAQIAAWRERARAVPLRQAHIGRGESQQSAPAIRNDAIAWIDEGSADVDDIAAQTFAHRLMAGFNRELFLGLVHTELHYAHYAPGGHYKKHLDRHTTSDARVLSFIAYLNESWQPEWGGQLKLYDADDQPIEVVQPEGGTIVLFRSEQFPHEVVSASRDRYSLTGWLRRRV